jgi:hypothetical protein
MKAAHLKVATVDSYLRPKLAEQRACGLAEEVRLEGQAADPRPVASYEGLGLK